MFPVLRVRYLLLNSVNYYLHKNWFKFTGCNFLSFVRMKYFEFCLSSDVKKLEPESSNTWKMFFCNFCFENINLCNGHFCFNSGHFLFHVLQQFTFSFFSRFWILPFAQEIFHLEKNSKQERLRSVWRIMFWIFRPNNVKRVDSLNRSHR